MIKRFDFTGEGELDTICDAILQWKPFPHIITFTGDLGAGKTTLIRHLVQKMGSEEAAVSPTFGLINEYHCENGRMICHTDWYRVKSMEELLDAGMTEYTDNPQWLVLVEWPEVGADLMAGEQVLSVRIFHGDKNRNYVISDEAN
ncbi:MAG: tRNA (adenosine(37)-N6)-threonylcarbamoyltransferase complex ATPase subunit type 1 TsaE [Bacteroidia bacterium]|nr:tRNA (adenosine(37)-N6)-threonylcarbamoyltransferase complex ATPase subunit type 1 TsaE [Bacteroidia bacterium]